jgi:hypothetical protein
LIGGADRLHTLVCVRPASAMSFLGHVAFVLMAFGGGCGLITVLAFCCGR